MNENRQEIRCPELHQPLGHYTDAVRFGNLLFVSGMMPTDINMNLVGAGDAAAQARQIMENIKHVLAGAGASFADILRVVVYLTDIKDAAAISPIRAEYFGASKPSSTLVEVSKLVLPGMKVEIEVTVGLPQDR